jgi:uncharacterized protein YqjF (DUF2071 family)
MLQDWRNLTFLHWRCEADAVQRMLPAKLQADLFDGSAWLGMTPFLLSGLRLPGMPSVPWLSTFPETNVRTYVRGPDGEAGIWFFTLETSRLLAAVGGRVAYGLPYRWASMSVSREPHGMTYRSHRTSHSSQIATKLAVIVRDEIARPDELERFLTARFRLYSVRADQQLIAADVEHEPWPLWRAGIWHVEENLVQSLGLPPIGEPLVHYSSGVHTRIGRPVQCDAKVLRPPLIRRPTKRASTP